MWHVQSIVWQNKRELLCGSPFFLPFLARKKSQKSGLIKIKDEEDGVRMLVSNPLFPMLKELLGSRVRG